MDPKDEIKNRLSITQVVAGYVQLKPAGKNMKGLCPFHQDSHPSLIVSEDKGMAWCFACQSGGDIFAFVQQIENITFPEALRLLADKAGVKLPDYSPEKKEKRDTLVELLEVATAKYEKDFWANKPVQEEVKKRHISDATLKKYRVGFAVQWEREMEKHLLEKGYSHKDILEAGLSVAEDAHGEKFKDKFRSRIMFPFFSATGTIVGYSGRAYGDFPPKFLNSPETPLFKKSEVLFGLNFAREEIRKKDFCLVVEGQFDCLACADHGIANVVAASGTAFSSSHARQIMRFSKNIVFALDADAAGISATKRAIEIAIGEGANVFVAPLPQGKDPDECLRDEAGEKEFLRRIEARQTAMDFLIALAFENRDPHKVEDKKAIMEELTPALQKIASSLERNHFLRLLAEKLAVDEKALLEDFGRADAKGFAFRKEVTVDAQKKPIAIGIAKRDYFIGMLLSFPALLPLAAEKIVEKLFPEGAEKNIFKKIKLLYNERGSCALKDIIGDLSEEEAKKWELAALYAEEKSEHIPETLREKEFKKLISQLNNENFNETYRALVQKLKATAEEGEENKELYLKIKQLVALKNSL